MGRNLDSVKYFVFFVIQCVFLNCNQWCYLLATLVHPENFHYFLFHIYITYRCHLSKTFDQKQTFVNPPGFLVQLRLPPPPHGRPDCIKYNYTLK